MAHGAKLGNRGAGFPPQLLKAEGKAWYTESLFIVSPAVQRSQTQVQAPQDSTWRLFRAGGIKEPVTHVQFFHGSESSGGRKCLCLWKKDMTIYQYLFCAWSWGHHWGDYVDTAEAAFAKSSVWREKVSGDDLGHLSCEHI